MPFQVSPGVNVSEIDLTTVIPSVSTTEGALAGVFRWGPVLERTLVDSEITLANRFGKPTSDNAETFFTAADFLSYGNKLFLTRVVGVGAWNAVGSSANNASTANVLVYSEESALETQIGSDFIARWPGALGNSMEVSICATPDVYESDITATITDVEIGGSTATFTGASSAAEIVNGDIIYIGNEDIGYQELLVESIVEDLDDPTINLITFTSKYRLADNTGLFAKRRWRHFNRVNGAPRENEFHVVVEDLLGNISDIPGAVMEVWEGLSVILTSRGEEGESKYYKDVIAQSSNWIWATESNLTTGTTVRYEKFTGGADGDSESSISLAKLAKGYDLYISPEDIDISLVLQGRAGHGTNDTGLANYIIDNVCEVRKDCVAFVSPARTDVVNYSGSRTDAVVQFRNDLSSSSYAVMDSGYKYRYDKYNDVYRYTPLNGDIAGLAVRTDNVRDPWFSPAGYNRGVIKNVVKLAWNPNKAQRDILYKADVNPVITQPGSGTLLFGDKTLLGRPSAFDRLNVRRLFITLEKAIAIASKSTLFEFNDEFTRAAFRNLVEPFLRDVQGRRGIYDFRVVCDTTNNTPEIIDRNEFVGDIYVKPAKSINFIQLNFVAVRTGVEFDEIVGQF